jgi:hypothetical protein
MVMVLATATIGTAEGERARLFTVNRLPSADKNIVPALVLTFNNVRKPVRRAFIKRG